MMFRCERKCKTAQQVAAWRLCMGCGACAFACPEKAVRLVDIVDRGIRPVVDSEKCKECGECISICPGIEITHQKFDSRAIPDLRKSWGPILEIWEGYATDSEIRFKGSSGGAATALALFCLEKQKVSGVFHIGSKSTSPLRNFPVFSKNREELLAYTGSRYSPAAPCEKFDWIIKAPYPVVFIGKPCDVVALRKSQASNPELNDKVGLTISIFCAGTPTTEGTNNILNVLDVTPKQVEELRYRGYGWPGMTTVKLKGNSGKVYEMTYQQSWGDILSKHGQTRCRLCPDSTGEFADISCGDPWYREVKPDEKGWSLVLARTEKGREILRDAMKSDYVRLERVESCILPQSQKAVLKRRQHLWGRLLMMRIMRIPVPCYKGFFLFKNWLSLPIVEKLRSFIGTLKRIVLRGWTKPLKPIISRDIPQDSSDIKKPLISVDKSVSKCKLSL